MTEKNKYRPVMLVIMDGIGINPSTGHNAVAQACKPYLEDVWTRFLTTRIRTSGEDVGLPHGVMGNSEVGHTNIGAGRVVYQALTRINRSIREKDFFSNHEIIKIIQGVKERKKTLHIMGLLSIGGVHASTNHVEAILEVAKAEGLEDVAIHCFMDGRDMPSKSGIDLVRKLESAIEKIGIGRIVNVSGRYYAMDRDKRWERTERAYRVLVGENQENMATSATELLKKSYENNITDEFIEPTMIVPDGDKPHRLQEGDGVFFWNFRPDRARQMTRALMDPDFDGFKRTEFPKIECLGMVRYDESFPLPIAYPPIPLKNVLAEVLEANSMKQFHTAETEKYAHVTFFLNGGREEPYKGEERGLVASPKVATYDLQPEMSAAGVTEGILSALEKDFDFLVVNYANGDMVGHTGDLQATIKSVETVDACLAKIVPPVIEKGGVVIITADHGNAEQMIWYETDEPHTQHTTFDVTLTICGEGFEAEGQSGNGISLKDGGRLADIAPIVLDLLGIDQPQEMTGESLIKRAGDAKGC